MKPFPWLSLTLVLLALELPFTLLYVYRKRLVKWLCIKALASGHPERVRTFLCDARTQRLITSEQESAWLKEFGLEQQHG